MKNISFLRNGKEFKPTKKQLKIVLDDYALMLIKKTRENQELKDHFAEFEDFIEEQGFEDLQDLERYIEQSIKAIELLDKKMKENQALKTRWEKLKKFVNTPKEIQQWDERFEVTVDSIKAKMQELEK